MCVDKKSVSSSIDVSPPLHTYTHVHIHTRTPTHNQTRTHTHNQTLKQTHTHTHTTKYTHAHTLTHHRHTQFTLRACACNALPRVSLIRSTVLAESVYDGVKARIRGLQDEVARRDNAIAAMKQVCEGGEGVAHL